MFGGSSSAVGANKAMRPDVLGNLNTPLSQTQGFATSPGQKVSA